MVYSAIRQMLGVFFIDYEEPCRGSKKVTLRFDCIFNFNFYVNQLLSVFLYYIGVFVVWCRIVWGSVDRSKLFS